MHWLEHLVNDMIITGECFCGEVSYQIAGALRDARSCHCSRCRKAFSSQASAYALVEPDDFKWLTGEHLLCTYADKQGCGFKFCGQCGSTLCGIVDGSIHGVTLGCVNGDPKIKLSRHIYVDSKASWEDIAEGVEQFSQAAPENE